MNNVDLTKKNYEKGLWSDEMLDKLETAGKIKKADKEKIKADYALKKAKK